MVFSGLVMLWRLAVCPTRTSPLSVKATIEGVVRAPSEFSMTVGLLTSTTATQELVVPRSIPIALAMMALHYRLALPSTDGDRCAERAGSVLPRARRESGNVLAGRTPRARSPGAARQAASLTSIFLASERAGLGIVIFRTPFDIVACTDEGSTPGGNCSTR